MNKPSFEVMEVVKVATLAKMGFSYEDQMKMPLDVQNSLLIYQSEYQKYEEDETKKQMRKK